MLKFIEAHDFHFTPGDQHTILGHTIARAARENEADFIVTSDLFKTPIMATDKGGINQLRSIVKEWLNICPVVAVEGTPSHDGPGCYGPLEDMGLVLLKPGKVYGYYRGIKKIQEVSNIPAHAILFGIPELNKKSIQAQLNISAEQANAEAVNLFNKYVAEYIAPMRLKHENIPAIGVMHGVISDSRKENANDVIIKASDIVIHTENLEVANIDRWSLGHIHKPWESQEICAGYSGSWGANWTELGFVPGMNLINIDEGYYHDNDGDEHPDPGNHIVTIDRLPYGTPERRKIIHPLSSYDKNIAYLLETEDPAAVSPAGHPLSELRYAPKPKETRRVTREQAEQAKTLKELFLLFDPEAPASAIAKLDEITEKVKQREINPIDVQLNYVKIEGCIFFKGKTAEFDLKNIDGVTELHAAGNGDGKSGLLSFCSPYPVVIGKDTDSGRPSAIKDFFDDPNSKIIKHLTVNGLEHEHLITIKGAHTENPKVECYLYIKNGETKVSQLSTTSFDEMFETCEKLYGSYNDYLLTTFYVQPLQGKTGSSLMSATMTDIRNLVQSIVGIDRESEKEYALLKVKTLTKEHDDLEAWIKGAEEFKSDIEKLKYQKDVSCARANTFNIDLSNKKADGENTKKKLEESNIIKQKSDTEKTRKANDEDRIKKIGYEIENKEDSIKYLKNKSSALEENRTKLTADDTAKKENIIIEKEQADYGNASSTLRTKITNEEARIKNEEKNIAADIKNNEEFMLGAKEHIERIKKPCPQCSYIDPELKEEIYNFEIKIEKAKEKIDIEKTLLSKLDYSILSQLQDDLKKLPIPAEPIKPTLSPATRETIEADIKAGMEAEALIKSHEARIIDLKNEREILQKNTYFIDEKIDAYVITLTEQLETLREQYNELNKQKATIEAEIKAIDDLIKKAQENEQKIKDTKDKIIVLSASIDDWQYLAKMLQPAKLPAFELDMVLDLIDIEASRIVEPYENAKYSFSTETQQQGKKSTVDRFDIRVFDSETGRDTSFVKFNPGTKAFLNDAYVKALIKQRNNRFKRNYSPIILDEADEPIHPGSLECFYDIQRNYFVNNKVIVVSHSPASHEHIANTIYMEELKK